MHTFVFGVSFLRAYHHRASRSRFAKRDSTWPVGLRFSVTRGSPSPGRIEPDRHGHILMTPLPGFRDSERQAQIIPLLIQFPPQGQTLPDTRISTADGAK